MPRFWREIRWREALPQDWVFTQKWLALALYEQASSSDGDDKLRLMRESLQAYRALSEVNNGEIEPQDFRMIQRTITSIDAEVQRLEAR